MTMLECIGVHACIRKSISTYVLARSLKEPRSNDTPVTKRAPSPQILVSIYHLPIKRTRPLREISGSRARVRRVHDEHGTFYDAKNKEVLKT